MSARIFVKRLGCSILPMLAAGVALQLGAPESAQATLSVSSTFMAGDLGNDAHRPLSF